MKKKPETKLKKYIRKKIMKIQYFIVHIPAIGQIWLLVMRYLSMYYFKIRFHWRNFYWPKIYFWYLETEEHITHHRIWRLYWKYFSKFIELWLLWLYIFVILIMWWDWVALVHDRQHFYMVCRFIWRIFGTILYYKIGEMIYFDFKHYRASYKWLAKLKSFLRKVFDKIMFSITINPWVKCAYFMGKDSRIMRLGIFPDEVLIDKDFYSYKEWVVYTEKEIEESRKKGPKAIQEMRAVIDARQLCDDLYQKYPARHPLLIADW